MAYNVADAVRLDAGFVARRSVRPAFERDPHLTSAAQRARKLFTSNPGFMLSVR